MTRMEVSLLAGCLLGLVVYSSNAWTQDDAKRDDGASSSSDARPAERAGPEARNLDLAPEVPTPQEVRATVRNNSRESRVEVAAEHESVARPKAVTRPKTVSRTIWEVVHETISAEELEEFQAFQKAKQTLKDAKDEGDRQKATETIKRHLEKQFERDLVQREKDLVAIEERVKLLRQQLGKRQAAKDEIISLRLKTITNSAEGLGFPGDEGHQDVQYEPSTVIRQPMINSRTIAPVAPVRPPVLPSIPPKP